MIKIELKIKDKVDNFMNEKIRKHIFFLEEFMRLDLDIIRFIRQGN